MSTLTLPAAGTWVLDPTHSSIELTARHLMVTKVRGTFKQFGGSITIGDSPETGSAEASIVAESIDTGVADRDTHLRSADFLDVENHPAITFRSTSIAPAGSGYALTGDLTIKGVTRPITLQVEYGGVNIDPWGNEKAAFSATGTFEREEWGIGWNVPLEAGGLLVSKQFTIDIEVQAARA